MVEFCHLHFLWVLFFTTLIIYPCHLFFSHSQRWQRRWFVLRVSDDKVTLDYFKDSSRSKLKGTILLSECQRVDQGLSFESKRKYHNAHIFDVVTPKRRYYLVTNTEEDMQRWVESICRACGFRSEDETSTLKIYFAPCLSCLTTTLVTTYRN